MSLPRENSRSDCGGKEWRILASSKESGGCIIDRYAQQDFPTVPSSRLNRNTIRAHVEKKAASFHLVCLSRGFLFNRIEKSTALDFVPFFSPDFSPRSSSNFRATATPLPSSYPRIKRAQRWWSFSTRVEFPPLKHASVIPFNWFACARKSRCLFRGIRRGIPDDEVRLKSNYFQLARFPTRSHVANRIRSPRWYPRLSILSTFHFPSLRIRRLMRGF